MLRLLSCKLMTAFSSEARKGCRQPERASLFVLHFLISRNFVMCRLNFCAEFATYFSSASSASSASSCSVHKSFAALFLARFLCKLRVLKKPVQKFQMNINHAHSQTRAPSGLGIDSQLGSTYIAHSSGANLCCLSTL